MIDLPHFDSQKFIDKATNFIKEKVKNANCDGLVIGLSGGIDSAVVAHLAVKALGPNKIHGYILPTKTTSTQDLEDAKLIQKQLNIDTDIIPIDDFYNNFITLCNKQEIPQKNNILASSNVKPRIRMSILYYYATIYNSLVIGTGNKTELSIGYFTKHGDGGVDLLPIGDLYKEEVIKLAKTLKIPQSIIEKPPTAGLLPEQTDEKEIGMTYSQLDRILYLYLEKLDTVEEISKKLNIKSSEIERIINLYNNSEHKRNTPPILKK